MKITRSQIRRIINEMINEDLSEVLAHSSGDTGIRDRAKKLKQQWDSLGIKTKRNPESDKAAKSFLRSLWDNTGSSWAKPYGTGGKKDPAGPAWSAATISTIVDDPKVRSIRHSDYRKGAKKRRKVWDKLPDNEKQDVEFVAFKPKEVETRPGDLRCYPRTGGTHCDICMDDGCTHIVGGNVEDDLASRNSSQAPKADMYIVRTATKSI